MGRPTFKLGADERGTATIELALFAPILATLVIGVIDMSMAFGRKLAVEQAAQRAIERVMQTTGEDTAEATVIAEAATQAGIPQENVSVAYRLECDETVVDDYDAECADGESEARYIEVTVNDRYTPMFPVHFSGLKDDGTYHIVATAGMRTQ